MFLSSIKACTLVLLSHFYLQITGGPLWLCVKQLLLRPTLEYPLLLTQYICPHPSCNDSGKISTTRFSQQYNAKLKRLFKTHITSRGVLHEPAVPTTVDHNLNKIWCVIFKLFHVCKQQHGGSNTLKLL